MSSKKNNYLQPFRSLQNEASIYIAPSVIGRNAILLLKVDNLSIKDITCKVRTDAYAIELQIEYRTERFGVFKLVDTNK